MNRKSFNLEIKAVNEDGFFSGYGAVFGNIDWYNDIILPGAFKNTLAQWSGKSKFPLQCSGTIVSMSQLGFIPNLLKMKKVSYVEGRLLVDDVPKAKSTHALLKAGAIDGLSIGYRTVKSAYNENTDIHELIELDLSEISIVTTPANEHSLVTSVKSKLEDGELPTLPEFEKVPERVRLFKIAVCCYRWQGVATSFERVRG